MRSREDNRMKRSSTKWLMLSVGLGLVSVLFMPGRVSAIPAFARRYETACTTEPGINAPGDSPFTLKRFMARYATRNLKAIWKRLGAHSTKFS